MKLLILTFSILLLASCTKTEVPVTIQESVARVNFEILCNRGTWNGGYNKWIKSGDILTCYETESNGKVISKQEFILF